MKDNKTEIYYVDERKNETTNRLQRFINWKFEVFNERGKGLSELMYKVKKEKICDLDKKDQRRIHEASIMLNSLIDDVEKMLGLEFTTLHSFFYAISAVFHYIEDISDSLQENAIEQSLYEKDE